jgi:hypothetical protein
MHCFKYRGWVYTFILVAFVGCAFGCANTGWTIEFENVKDYPPKIEQLKIIQEF